ncbi:MAG: hypothetical protein JNL21_14200 [Myxococcales bacterium]|nr:hypothetical protein [Myxococcales bacterium]
MRARDAALRSVSTVLLVACSSEAPYRPELGAPRAPPPRAIILEPPDAPLPPPKEIVAVDPNAEEVLRRNLDRPTQAFEEKSPPKVTARALEHTALSEARGLEAEPVRSATLEEGARAVLPLPLAPAECVTIIAHGGLGVAEVDLFLVDRTEGSFRILAQDTRTGQVAIVGGQRGCYVALGVPVRGAELWAQVRSGAGPVVVGVYRASRP